MSLTACGYNAEVEDASERDENIIMAREILKIKKERAADISKDIKDCIESATKITHLTAAGNDAAEVVQECKDTVTDLYGIRDPFLEGRIHLVANRKLSTE